MYELERHRDDSGVTLSRRERQALGLARLGWDDEETAILFGIDRAAASRAVAAAVEKLGAHTLADAIETARHRGILR